MPAELFRVKLLRDNAADTWGFNLSGGGDQLLVISEVDKVEFLVTKDDYFIGNFGIESPNLIDFLVGIPRFAIQSFNSQIVLK